MNNKVFMRKVFKRFSEFVAVASAYELELLVYDAKYTSAFSYRLKQIIDDLRESGKPMAEFSVLFNTNGDIAIIDSEIVGRYIADKFTVDIEDYYKSASLNKIVRYVVNGNSKVKQDFVAVAYRLIYEAIDEIYMEIKCRKDMLTRYKERYNLIMYNEEDSSAVVGALLILEDICKYMGINEQNIIEVVNNCVYRKYSQE